METDSKLIVILGPTASGKTGLSLKLAKKFHGEIISADSRQIYKGMDIGSGKVTKKEMGKIPHYLLDVASPRQRFTVAQYQKIALKAVRHIHQKGGLPILVGGTGFYIQSIADGVVIPEVKPDWKLRQKLAKIPLPELVKQLQMLDPARAGIIDQNNPRRVVRALELALKLGSPVPALQQRDMGFKNLILGIKKSPKELKILIAKRLKIRLKNDAMIKEVKNLRKILSWKRLEEFGLEYRYVAQYLQNKITKEEMIKIIKKESEHYAKRQMTWFKRDQRIHWIKTQKQAENLLKNFLKK
jgi:tRNA dimethylallyltransferase